MLQDLSGGGAAVAARHNPDILDGAALERPAEMSFGL